MNPKLANQKEPYPKERVTLDSFSNSYNKPNIIEIKNDEILIDESDKKETIKQKTKIKPDKDKTDIKVPKKKLFKRLGLKIIKGKDFNI